MNYSLGAGLPLGAVRTDRRRLPDRHQQPHRAVGEPAGTPTRRRPRRRRSPPCSPPFEHQRARGSSSTASTPPPRASTSSAATACRPTALGRFDFTAGGQLQRHRRHQDARPADASPTLPQPAFLFDRGNVPDLREGHAAVASSSAAVDWSNWATSARRWRTHLLRQRPDPRTTTRPSTTTTGDAWLVDLEGRYKLPKNVGAGARRQQPVRRVSELHAGHDQQPDGPIGFPSYSPFGFNGRFLYGRLSVNW